MTDMEELLAGRVALAKAVYGSRKGGDSLPIVTVYDRPRDYPTKCVARLWILQKKVLECTSVVVMADTLEEVRSMMPLDMFPISAQTGDDPTIVETWL